MVDTINPKLEGYLQLSKEVCSLCRDIAHRVSSELGATEQEQNIRDQVLGGLAIKIYRSFECLIEDARRERSEAMHHLKTIIESFIYFHWVRQDLGDKRARLVLARANWEKMGFFKKNSDYPDQARYLNVWEAEFEELTKGMKNEWSAFKKSKIEKLADSIEGLGGWYKRPYKLACEPAHITDLYEHMPLSQEPISLDPPQHSILSALTALEYGLHVMFGILLNINISNLSDVGLEENITRLENRLSSLKNLNF